jgi:hypothetical protein
MQVSSDELFRRLAAWHAYIPNSKRLIPSRSLATSEVYTLYLGIAKGVSEGKAVSLRSVGIDFGLTQGRMATGVSTPS